MNHRKGLRMGLIAVGFLLSLLIIELGVSALAQSRAPCLGQLLVQGLMLTTIGAASLAGVALSAFCPTYMRRSLGVGRTLISITLCLPVVDIYVFLPEAAWRALASGLLLSIPVSLIIALSIASAWLRFFAVERSDD